MNLPYYEIDGQTKDIKEYRRNYYLQHKDKMKQQNQKSYEKHKEERLKTRAEWQRQNKDKLKVVQDKYCKSKLHKCLDCEEMVSRQCMRCRSCASHHTLDIRNPKRERGIKISAKGYRLVYAPNHHKHTSSRYVFEHIILWEKYHNQDLPDGWVVHHLNGIKNDNSTSNLRALPNQKHNNILMAKAKRIQELEALLRQQGQLL